MTETLLVDYAWQVPSVAAIKAAGYQGVMRYLSPDVSKNLTAGERDALHKAGLSIGLVWESTANRAGQGHQAGANDAAEAEAQAKALGYPASCPLFFAVDFDASPFDVAPYFQGVRSVATGAIGIYGSARVVEGVPVKWKWQACAWSAGRVSNQAHLYQRLAVTTAHPLPGTDENVVLRPFPLWTAAKPATASTASADPSTPGQPAAPAATLRKRPTVILIRTPANPAVYITDGLTKRHVVTPAEEVDLLRMTGQTQPVVVAQATCDRIPDAVAAK